MLSLLADFAAHIALVAVWAASMFLLIRKARAGALLEELGKGESDD